VPFQAVEAAQQGAFATAAGAEDDHHFAAAHLQVDALEHLVLAKNLLKPWNSINALMSAQRRSSTREAADSG
jgi:hypothetical protein